MRTLGTVGTLSSSGNTRNARNSGNAGNFRNNEEEWNARDLRGKLGMLVTSGTMRKSGTLGTRGES